MNSILSDYNKPGYVAEPVASTIYKDVSLNPFVHPLSGSVLASTDIDAIKNSIKNIILTPKGSRVFYPEFGTRIGNLLFELASASTASIIRDEILSGISEFEPRASDVIVSVNDDPDGNYYRITVGFTIIYGGQAEFQFILNRTR
jgi:phage baseplate assembly protein W